MGYPDKFYKMAMQEMAYQLTWDDDKEKAREIKEELNEEKLENYILEKKKVTPEDKFFYCAGIGTMCMMQEVKRNKNGDELNAAIGGLVSFEEFLGLEEYEKDDDVGLPNNQNDKEKKSDSFKQSKTKDIENSNNKTKTKTDKKEKEQREEKPLKVFGKEVKKKEKTQKQDKLNFPFLENASKECYKHVKEKRNTKKENKIEKPGKTA